MFLQKIKEELIKIEIKKNCCEKSQLYSALLCLKFFHTHSPSYIDNLEFARYISEKISSDIMVMTEIRMYKKKSGYAFNLCNENERERVSKYFNHEMNFDNINFDNIKNDCCRKVFLRTAFLICGKILEPEEHYKVEFVFNNEVLAKNFAQYINSFEGLNFNLKLTQRKSDYVLYCKDSSQIQDMLTFIGAKNSAMEFMQIKMFKEEINNINRKSNFETANMDKTFSASAKQVAAIVQIESEKGLDFLDKDLREIAEYRLEHPQVSLKTVAEELGISRSAANHRLSKIIGVYEKMKKE